MSNTALKLQTLTGSAEAQAFDAALSQVEAQTKALAFVRTDAKEGAKAVQSAARAAAWAMVDVLVTVDLANREAEGDRMAALIAAARGVKDDSLRPYRQRGRAVAKYLDVIRKENRDKADPLTVAKNMLATAEDQAKRAASIANHDKEAREIAAGELSMTPEVFQAAMIAGTDGAAIAYYEAVKLCEARATVLADIAKACAVLQHADAATKAKAQAIFANFK